MKARLALAAALAFPLGLSAMPTAVESPASKISLKQAVKLGDGSVLPAGAYDVQIHYKGFGNAAEFSFFLGGVFKGKTNAEARGFPAQAPVSVNGGGKIAIDDVKGPNKIGTEQTAFKVETTDHKDQSSYKEQKHPLELGPVQAFSWSAHGFTAGGQGKVAPAGRGSLKLSFDSSNSAAGFSAILPYVEKGSK